MNGDRSPHTSHFHLNAKIRISDGAENSRKDSDVTWLLSATTCAVQMALCSLSTLTRAPLARCCSSYEVCRRAKRLRTILLLFGCVALGSVSFTPAAELRMKRVFGVEECQSARIPPFFPCSISSI